MKAKLKKIFDSTFELIVVTIFLIVLLGGMIVAFKWGGIKFVFLELFLVVVSLATGYVVERE